ncbi:ArsR/SmtB family transcription factor [Desulfovibrio litoralis]|uniref:Transcriptional regulator, ArsR family n=1 Tax=Desulfovibrio litoralis DSM 11393 TaxID=1121455 RepID=A0A1M7TIY0_9BACT|nr:metalloregulator ArsR/SmtB family transcription factor [Desulfovibrio litoralis]SHN70646.1 transcriptional regulator, ArsR family [Desulfovibrio litoralis DSM 11393]
MNTLNAAKIFEALSSEIRLNIFKLLVKHGDSGLVAGDIAELIGIPSTNLSFHLKALLFAELVFVEQEGRFLRYRANIPLMLNIVGFLTEECCAGQPEKCLAYRQASGISDNILGLCTKKK